MSPVSFVKDVSVRTFAAQREQAPSPQGQPIQRSCPSLASAWALRSATRLRCSSVSSTLLALSRNIISPPTIDPIATTIINHAYHGITLSLRQIAVGGFSHGNNCFELQAF